MLFLRSLVFNILFYAALIGIMILGLPTMLLGPDRVRGLARIWGRVSLWLLRVVCGTTIEFRGLDNIPRSGGFIVAAKHQSVWEIFALTTVFTNFTFVLKRELMHIPLFGWYLARSRQIAIDRSKGRAALTQVAQQARVLLREGRQLIIFPEGTRRPSGAPPSYKFGVAFVYAENGVPCVPVGLNSGLFWPRRQFIRRPGTVVVDIMPAIQPGLPSSEFIKLLQAQIETSSTRLNEEAADLDPSLRQVLELGAGTAA